MLKILIVTMHQDKEYLYQALAAGADGYFLKRDADTELFAAIDKIRKGTHLCVPPSLRQAGGSLGTRSAGGSGKPVLTTRETGGPEADRRGEGQQRGCRSALHQRPHGGAPPRQHHGKIEPEKDRRPRQIRHPEGLPLISLFPSIGPSHFGVNRYPSHAMLFIQHWDKLPSSSLPAFSTPPFQKQVTIRLWHSLDADPLSPKPIYPSAPQCRIFRQPLSQIRILCFDHIKMAVSGNCRRTVNPIVGHDGEYSPLLG